MFRGVRQCRARHATVPHFESQLRFGPNGFTTGPIYLISLPRPAVTPSLPLSHPTPMPAPSLPLMPARRRRLFACCQSPVVPWWLSAIFQCRRWLLLPLAWAVSSPLLSLPCLRRWSTEIMTRGGKERWMSKETRIHLIVLEGGQQQQVVVQL